MVPLDGSVLDGAVHPLHLAVGPRMVRLVEPMFDAALTADLIEAVDPIACCPAITIVGKVSELDAVIGEDHMEPVRNGFDQGFQEGHGRGAVCLLVQLGKGELGRAMPQDTTRL